jgi:beta-glucosidase
MDWEIYPDGLRDVYSMLQRHYDVPPLYVSENGAAFEDELVGDTVHDPDRFHYIRRHLQVIADMIESGADIRGYICWTLLDNFEWAEGHSKRFGLVHMDFDTQKRTMKDSGKAYARLNASKARLTAGRRGKRLNVAP